MIFVPCIHFDKFKSSYLTILKNNSFVAGEHNFNLNMYIFFQYTYTVGGKRVT